MIHKLIRSNLSADAHSFLRGLLTSGSRYQPGDRINVESLSRELGVSRTPLWGAINRLEAEGIVEIIPRVGVYLIKYDPRRVVDIYYARMAIEPIAARLAAQRITPRELKTMRVNVRAQRNCILGNRLDDYHREVLRFHEMVVASSRSPTLHRLYSIIQAQILAMRGQRKTLPPMALPKTHDDHGELLQALEQRDADSSEGLMREHLLDLISQLGKGPAASGQNAVAGPLAHRQSAAGGPAATTNPSPSRS